jgi:hypothetical protein
MKKLILHVIVILSFLLIGAQYTGDALDHINEEHIHSASSVYPTLAGGTSVTSGGGAWALSAGFTQIVPAATIGERFDIHHLSIENISANVVFEIVLYYGASNTECGRVRVTKNAAQDGTMNIPFQTIIMPADSRIQAKVADSGGGNSITISIFYHTYD